MQDIGLIFLSAIASSVADLTYGTHGLSVAIAMGTALVSLCIATLIVGLLTLLFGECGKAWESVVRVYGLSVATAQGGCGSALAAGRCEIQSW